jgi:PAS domain S-box-containing protein
MQIPEDVIALADELHAHLQHGDVAGLGPVDLAFDGIWPDPERAARIVLADVAHCAEQDSNANGPVTATRWRELAEQLRSLELAIHRDLDRRELSQGEERFRLALRGSSIIVYQQDTELRHTWIYNPQHGLEAEAVLGKTDAELVRPEDAAILAVIKRRVLKTGVGERAEVCVTVEGEAAYYDMTIEPLRGPAGDIVGVTGAATNVTALKLAEKTLAQREAQLVEAQRLAQVGSWELDLATNRYSWSDEHYRIFGIDSHVDPLTPAVAQAFIHPDDLEWSRAMFEESLRTGEPYECDLRIVRPDGEVRLIRSRGAMLQATTGQPQRMVGTAQDITDLKQAEEERAMQREREARLSGMLFAARDLAARMNQNLAESCGAIDALQPESALAPHLRKALDAGAALSKTVSDMAALQRPNLLPPADRPGEPDPDGN